jgi:predicted ATPase/DNA-binding SARP family transcriptional activator
VEFRVLGLLEAIEADRPITLGGHKQRIVLSLLLLHANTVVSTDALVEAVWGDEPPDRAPATLQVYVANLRRLLNVDGDDRPRERLIRDGNGYVLRADEDEVDVGRFRRLVEEARAARSCDDPARASLLLRTALELWRGAAFPDLVERQTIPEVTALEEQRLSVLEERIDADLEAGREDQVVDELAALVARHPLRERLHAQRMLALYRTQRQADALAAYQTMRTMLRDELGVDPSDDLQQLERDILRQDPSLDLVQPSKPAVPTLPVAPTPMIGRERELATLTKLVNDPSVRLVTLLGPGGSGKSRLGLEVATEVTTDFADGVFYCPLAPLNDSSLVVPAIASALNVRETAEWTLLDILIQRLEARRALLVLDNFEQLLDAAGQVAELMSRTRYLTVLVTSRSRLQISGEYEYPVDPLTLPELDPLPPIGELTQNAAVRLFVERAQAVSPGYELTDRDGAAVAAICHRVDGLPLAIELAAARCRVLAPPAILTRLDARLRLLTGGPHDVPTRQQTLRGTIEWSYDLLESAERLLFTWLAAFRGGCTLEAVEAVCTSDGEDPLDLLDRVDSLVSQSLLQGRRTADGDTRYLMLQTIQEYAEELLDGSHDGQQQRRRHAEHYLQLAETAEQRLTGGDQQLDWLARLTDDHDNMRAAMSWSLAENGDDSVALRLAAALWHFWEMSGSFSEGRRWLEGALAVSDQSPPEVRLRALSGAATMIWCEGDSDRARRMHETARDLARELGDERAEAFALNAIGTQVIDEGDYGRAEKILEQARALALRAGDLRTAAMAQHNTAELVRHRKQYSKAADYYEASVRIYRQLDDQWALVPSLNGLGLVALRQGDRERAADTLRDSLRLAAEVGENYWLAESIEGLAAVAEASDDPMRAVRLVAAADAMRRRIAAPVQLGDQAEYESLLGALHSQLDDPTFDSAWSDGQQLTAKQAIAEALAT